MNDFAYIAGSDDSQNLAQKVRDLINPYEPSFLWDKNKQWALVKDVLCQVRRQKGVVPISGIYAMLSFTRTRLSFFRSLPVALAVGLGRLSFSSPAWNDYHISRWCLTGDDEDIRFLCERALIAPRNSDGSGIVPTSLKAAGYTSAAWTVGVIGAGDDASHHFQLAVLRLYPTKHEQILTHYIVPA